MCSDNRRIVLFIAISVALMFLWEKMLPPACRFYPSCSAYAETALRRHGALKGGWIAARRLARCHPFHPGGIDPVP